MRARGLRPHVTSWHSGTTHWHGAVVWALAPPNATVRVGLGSRSQDFTVPIADLPAGASAGAPCCCRMDLAAAPFSILEVRESHFCASADAGLNAMGVFCAAAIPRSLTLESEFFDD